VEAWGLRMLRLKSFSVVILMLFFAKQQAVAQVISDSQRLVGDWMIFGTFDPKTEKTYCSLSMLSPDGTLLIIGMRDIGSIYMILESKRHILPSKSVFPISLKTNRGVAASSLAVSRGQNSFVTEDIPFNSGLIDELKRGAFLTIRTEYGEWSLSLRGSNNAITETLRCVAQYRDYQPSTPLLSEERDYRNLEYQLATKVISSMGIVDFEFIEKSQKDDESRNAGVSWAASDGNVIGRAFVMDQVGTDVTLGNFQGSQSSDADQACLGEVSSATSIKHVDGIPTLEHHLVCKEPGGGFYSVYSSLLNEGFYVETSITFFGDFLKTNPSAERAVKVGILAASFALKNIDMLR
jgi:hypothetical protein